MPEQPADRPATPFTIRLATREDAEAIARVIRDSFATVVAQIGMDIPPAHETAEEVLVTFDAGDVALLAELPSGEAIGTVRGEALAEGAIMVRRLGVLPEYRGGGIARALMLALEGAYPTATRFELFTGAQAAGPLALYASLGYRLIEREAEEGVPIVYLDKRR